MVQPIPRLGKKPENNHDGDSDGLLGHHHQGGDGGQAPGHQLSKWSRRLDLADRAVLRVAGELQPILRQMRCGMSVWGRFPKKVI